MAPSVGTFWNYSLSCVCPSPFASFHCSTLSQKVTAMKRQNMPKPFICGGIVYTAARLIQNFFALQWGNHLMFEIFRDAFGHWQTAGTNEPPSETVQVPLGRGIF